jgi:hypothetical protein
MTGIDFVIILTWQQAVRVFQPNVLKNKEVNKLKV